MRVIQRKAKGCVTVPRSRVNLPDIRLQGFVIKGTDHVLLESPNSQQGNVGDDSTACGCKNSAS